MTQGDRLTGRAPVVVLVLGVLSIALAVTPVHAGVSAFWQPLGGSASGGGVSQTPAPRTASDASVAVDAAGRPVVVYADLASSSATQGAIVVKRWNGSAWETLSAAVGQGYLPQVRLAPAGDIVVAWLHDVGGSTEIRLRKRAFDGTTFEEVGGSDSAGGISGANPGITLPFSLSVGANGQPVVAFLAAALTGNVDVTTTPAVIDHTTQVYVRQWNGAEWVFLGSDFTGTPAGASNAVSFTSASGSVEHWADTPALAIDSTGAPVVAFTYVTRIVGVDVVNTDIYVTRWNGTSWEPVGPGVPAGDDAVGRGGAGGVSQSDTISLNPSLAAAPDGTLALAWEEAPAEDTAYVWVRVWNGTSWIELGGSAHDSGFTQPLTQNEVPQVAVGADGHPVVAWNAHTPASPAGQIFVKRWSGSDWVEPAFHSATQGGISDAALEAFAPALALTPPGGAGTADVPTVTWLDARPSNPTQVFLRQLVTGAPVTLSVSLVGNGSVASTALDVQCGDTACAGDVPIGTSVTLTATPKPGGAFMGWGGACASRGVNPSCPLTLMANTDVTATFKRFHVTVGVATPAGTVGQGTLGTVSGTDFACGPAGVGICAADISQGTPVVLEAVPQPGNRFVGWGSGPCAGSANATCPFKVTANSSSTALFRGTSTVSVLKSGTGKGTVAGGGLLCGPTCTLDLFTGAAVTLVPTPAIGSTFAGWSGDVCDGQRTGSCAFTVSGTDRSVTVASQTLTATFVARKQKLTVTTAGAGYVIGGVTIDCAAVTSGHPACTAEYDFGTAVDLTPIPDVDNRLVSWTGCTSLNRSICRAVLTANLSVRATFGAARTLFVSASGNGAGRITANTLPALVCISNCSVSQLVAGNTSVLMTPAPAVGTTFRWLTPPGDICAGSGACTALMSQNRSAVGEFTLKRLALKVTRRTNGTVMSDPLPDGGLDCGTNTTTCAGVYDFGTPVVLRATADDGAVFAGWTGVTCLVGGALNASCAFKLTANTTATPTFRPRTRVTVVKGGNGSGLVIGPGISCGNTCAADEFDAKLITLTATRGIGSRFTGWGDACAFRGTNTSCSFVPAGANQTVSATFQLIPLTLTVTPRTNGNVVTVDDALPDTIDCGSGGVGKCSATLNYGTVVHLQATPIAGSRLVGWAGCTTVAGANCSVKLIANTSLVSTYRDITTVGVTKTGQGLITSLPAGIACGLTCASMQFDFPRGTLVRLTPTPRIGWDFIGWTGDCSGAGPCSLNTSGTLSMGAAANFSIQLKTLRVTVVGNGSVMGPDGPLCDTATTPCAPIFPYGTAATLVPVAAPGFKFTGWTQDCLGAAAMACKPQMTANHSVTATFKPVFGVTVTRQGNAAPGVITASPPGINCGTVCAADYLAGTLVTFTRGAPATGRTFRWLGDCAFRGSNTSCTLKLDTNKSIVVDYSLQRLGLTVNTKGPGTITGLAEGDCSTLHCVSVLDYGTRVLLQAMPSSDPQSDFVGWTGCTTTAGANCSVTLLANATVSATFKPILISLAVTAASANASVPLSPGARRQYAAVATFSDMTTQNVTAQAQWSSADTSVVTVLATSGLATGGTRAGNTSITAVFRARTRSANASIAVVTDTPVASSIKVACSPYGDPGGSLACLPSALSFEVECQATAAFARGGTYDVTDQATWVSTNAAVARFLGLSEFGGPIMASFRIFAGAAAIRAALNGGISSGNTSLGNRWVVQGTPLRITGVTVAPSSVEFTDATPVQLTATAALAGTTGTAASCTAPSMRDFSLLTTWASNAKPVADVSFFGLVTPVASGSANVHWRYAGTVPPIQGDIPITVP